MTKTKVEMTEADRSYEAHWEWAVASICQSEKRNLDFSKFFFSVTAVTLGLIPFTEAESSATLSVCILLLFVAAIVAILIAEPAHFELKPNINTQEKYRIYSVNRMFLRYAWIFLWIISLALILNSLSILTLRAN